MIAKMTWKTKLTMVTKLTTMKVAKLNTYRNIFTMESMKRDSWQAVFVKKSPPQAAAAPRSTTKLSSMYVTSILPVRLVLRRMPDGPESYEAASHGFGIRLMATLTG